MPAPLPTLLAASRMLREIFLTPLRIMSAPFLQGSRRNAWRATCDDRTRRRAWTIANETVPSENPARPTTAPMIAPTTPAGVRSDDLH